MRNALQGSEIPREQYTGDQVADDRGDAYADQARFHETVVQEVFSYHGSTGPVEVDRGDVGRIVRDEEISIDRRQYAKEHDS